MILKSFEDVFPKIFLIRTAQMVMLIYLFIPLQNVN